MPLSPSQQARGHAIIDMVARARGLQAARRWEKAENRMYTVVNCSNYVFDGFRRVVAIHLLKGSSK